MNKTNHVWLVYSISDSMPNIHVLTLDSFASGSLCSRICTKMLSNFTVWFSSLPAWLTSDGSLRALHDWPDWALCCMLARAQPRNTEPDSSKSSQCTVWLLKRRIYRDSEWNIYFYFSIHREEWSWKGIDTTVHALPLFEMKEENPIVYVGVGKGRCIGASKQTWLSKSTQQVSVFYIIQLCRYYIHVYL